MDDHVKILAWICFLLILGCLILRLFWRSKYFIFDFVRRKKSVAAKTEFIK